MIGNSDAGLMLGLLLSIVHLAGETLSPKLERYHCELISFSAGVLITLLFSELLPIAARDNLNFTFILLGFVAFHSLEKYVYQRHPSQFKRELGRLDSAGFFVVNFLNGFALMVIYDFDPQLAYLFAIPMAIVELASAAFLSGILEKTKNGGIMKLVLSASVLLGALAATVFRLDSVLANNVFAFAIGTMFYIVIKDMMPRHREGRLEYFLAGVGGMYAAIVMFG